MDALGGALVASSALVDADVVLEERVSVWWNAVLRGDDARITIGAGTNIQDFVMVHADPDAPMVVGRDVTVGHRATLHGLTIGDRALIAIGAVLLTGTHIGEDAIVAAGAVVRPGTEVPAGMLVAGVPAKVIRPVTEEERKLSIWRAERYWKVAQARAGRS